MKFDVGTILYIIITIIVVIAGAVGRKKKPAVNNPNTQRKTGLEGFLSSFGEQFENFAEPEKSAEAYQEEEILVEDDVEPEVSTETSNMEMEDDVEESIFGEYEGVYDPDAIHNHEIVIGEGERSTGDDKPMQIVELEEESKADFHELFTNFDLRKAVIYSIIIDKVEY